MQEVGNKYEPSEPEFLKVPVDNFNNGEKMLSVMQSDGFINAEVTQTRQEFFYADEEEWYKSQWSHGSRRRWESVEPSAREQWKAELMEGLQAMKQPEGIPQLMHALYTVAIKPQAG